MKYDISEYRNMNIPKELVSLLGIVSRDKMQELINELNEKKEIIRV